MVITLETSKGITHSRQNGRLEKSEYVAVRRQFAKNLALKLQLCAALEDMADRLPYGVGPDHSRMLLESLGPILKRAQIFEETTVFPILASHLPDILPTLNRLEAEHFDDESFAMEIHECLVELFRKRSHANIDSLSYMLRGFFAGLRRHIAFEQEHLIPILVTIERNYPSSAPHRPSAVSPNQAQ